VKAGFGPRGLLLALLVLAGATAALWVRTRPRFGPLRATPIDRRLSVEVGEAIHFSAAAPGAVEFTWSIWGSAVSHLPTWTYVALPEDAGWQQVTLVVRGTTGSTFVRSWDVGVVPPVPPALEVTPPPGRVAVPAGGRATFHCGARVPAARPSDRVWFEWTVDGRTMSRQEQSAAEAVSEFFLPALPAGSHRVVVRVNENERSSSLAEWVLESSGPLEPRASPAPIVEARRSPPPEPPAQVVEAQPEPRAEPPAQVVEAKPAPPPEPPAQVVARAAPPAVVPPSPPARIPESRPAAPSEGPAVAAPPGGVRSPVPSRVTGAVGERMRFATGMASSTSDASYDWSVDGRRVQQGPSPSLEYVPETPGTHRVAVALRARGATVRGDSWQVTARGSRPARAEASATARKEPAPLPEPARVASLPTTSLPARVVPLPATTLPRVPPATAPRTEERATPPVEVARATRPGAALSEDEVHHWLDEYAHAWSKHDVRTLQRMGQVRSQADAERLLRYFGTVEDLRVDVHVRAVRVDGERAAVEFDRVDTMTDPSGRRQELRLPPQHKEIERTPEGLRFVN